MSRRPASRFASCQARGGGRLGAGVLGCPHRAVALVEAAGMGTARRKENGQALRSSAYTQEADAEKRNGRDELFTSPVLCSRHSPLVSDHPSVITKWFQPLLIITLSIKEKSQALKGNSLKSAQKVWHPERCPRTQQCQFSLTHVKEK